MNEKIKKLWRNTRLFYTNTKRDIRSYSKINQTVNDYAELIKKIREQNYDPIRQEIVEEYITERMK